MTTVAEIFETMSYGPAPESDAPVREWLARHKSEFGHYIKGRWTTPQGAVRGRQSGQRAAAGARVAGNERRRGSGRCRGAGRAARAGRR